MRTLKILASLALGGATQLAVAAQFGPVFPTHRYPTDQSFHLGYRLDAFYTNSNFIGPTLYQRLDGNASFSLFQHTLIPEFQPNRRLSVGGYFSAISAAVNPAGKQGVSATKLGDQRLFVEYRFFDSLGKSLGLALVPKFPGYTNPTVDELSEQGVTTAVLVGDAQIDFSVLLTSELWPSDVVRIRLDGGMTIRTDAFANEMPFMVSVGYVNPRVDLDLKVRGNASLGSTAANTDTTIEPLRTAFAHSDYAFSDTPWTIILQPTAEFWFTPQWAIGAEFAFSALGNNSARFRGFGFGLTFREAQAKRVIPKTFKEVDLSTDQESGVFQGELQEKANQPSDPADFDDIDL